ncbi:EVI5-like protein isoform X2 [Dysidea avara]
MSVDSIEPDDCGPQPIVCDQSAEKPADNEDLLKMLEEQNKMLEKDKRALTRITSKADVTERNSISSAVSDPKSENDDVLPQQDSPPLSRKSTEEELWELWGIILRDWEENSKKKAKLIRQLVYQGIPEHMRGMAWQCLSGAHNREVRDKYPKLITEVSPFEKQIVRDLARTFPDQGYFKERDGMGQESLLNVLKAYSVYDREVGYCQGSPFIVGMLLMQQIPEEEVFCIFIRLMEHFKLREVFKPSMADLSLYFYQLEKMIEELLPQLHIHFQAVGCHTSIYASPWFLTLFASSLSLNVAFRIMDIFFIDGIEIIFRIAVALLEYHSNELLRLDLEDMIKFFQKSLKAAHDSDPDALINVALKVKYNAKKMKRWEKDHIIKREKLTQEADELMKVKSDNSQLSSRITALEKECASLADKLIQGQVTRAQEAEERFTLRNEVATLRRILSTKTSNDTQSDEDGERSKSAEGDETVVKVNGKEENDDDIIDGDDKEQELTEKPETTEDSSSVTSGELIPVVRFQSIERELMAAKEEINDAAEQLEQKRRELRESLRREALVLQELQATQLCVQELQKELLAAKKELTEIKCSRKMAYNEEQATDTSSHSDSTQPAPDSVPNVEGTAPLTNNYPVTTHNDKDSHRYDTDKKLVIDWV